MTTNIANALFKATGATTSRTWAAYCSDIINVKDFGATGDGLTNDAAAIQSAFDTAYGSSSAPHGESNKYNNRPVFFPPGLYICNSQLTLTSVSGGLIFGSGQDSIIQRSGGANNKCLVINGMNNSRFDSLSFNLASVTAGDGSIAIDLDWDGSTSAGVALNYNIFTNMTASGDTGIRIGKSSNDGEANTFIGIKAGAAYTGMYGFHVVSSQAVGQVLMQCGASGMGAEGISGYGAAVRVQGGSVGYAAGMTLSTNPVDFLIENASTVVLSGERCESFRLADLQGGGTLIANGVNQSTVVTGYNAYTSTGTVNGVSLTSSSKCILDGCLLLPVFGSSGILYARNSHWTYDTPSSAFYNVSSADGLLVSVTDFGGNVVQRI